MQLSTRVLAIAYYAAVSLAQTDQLITRTLYPATCPYTVVPFPSAGWVSANGSTTPYFFSTPTPTYGANNTLGPSQISGSVVETATAVPIACPGSNATVYIPPGSNEGINGTQNYFTFCDVTYNGEDVELLSSVPTPERCIDRCSADTSCVAIAYNIEERTCLKKGSVTLATKSAAPGSIFIFSLPYLAELEKQVSPETLPTPSPSSTWFSLSLPTSASATSFVPTTAPLSSSSIPFAPWTTITPTRLSPSAGSSASVYLRTTITGGVPVSTVIGGSTTTFSTAGALTTAVVGGYTATYTTGGVTQVLTESSSPTPTTSSVANAAIGPCPAYNGRLYTDYATNTTYLVTCAATYNGTLLSSFSRSRLAKRATVDECSDACSANPECVAYTSLASGQCDTYREVFGQTPSSEPAISAILIETEANAPPENQTTTTSFEPLLPQLSTLTQTATQTNEVTLTQSASSYTYTTTLFSVLPASTVVSTELITTSLQGSTFISTVERTTTLPASTSISTLTIVTAAPAETVTQPASSFTYTTTLTSVLPASTVVSTELITTSLQGSTFISTVERTTTLPASTSISTQIIVTTAPPQTLTYTAPPIVTTYVETYTTQLPASTIVSTAPVSIVVSTYISTLPASTFTATYLTTLDGATIVVTSSAPGQTETEVFTTREVSTATVTSVSVQEASTIVSYVTQTISFPVVTYTAPPVTTVLETTIISTQPTTITALTTIISTQPTTITASTTIVSTQLPTAYGLDALPTCAGTGKTYTAYDRSQFVMLCGLPTFGDRVRTVATESYSACVEICNQYGTSCAAISWQSSSRECTLYSFMYEDFARSVPKYPNDTDSAIRLTGPSGTAGRSQVIQNGAFDTGGLVPWAAVIPGRGQARVVDGAVHVNVDSDLRGGGPVSLTQSISASPGNAFMFQLRLGATATPNSPSTGSAGVEIAVIANSVFLGYFEMLLGEEPSVHYASGTFVTGISEIRLEANCIGCGPEVTILLDDIALYVYPSSSGGLGLVTTTLIPTASTITQTQVTLQPTTVISTEITTQPLTVVSIQPTTIISTATPTPSNFGLNGYNSVPSCLPTNNGKTYVAASGSYFAMLCGQYTDGDETMWTTASSYSACIERCNFELGCGGLTWMSSTQECRLFSALVNVLDPTNSTRSMPGRFPPRVDVAIRLSPPGGLSARQQLVSNGGFDQGLAGWTSAELVTLTGGAVWAYATNLTAISQQIQVAAGDTFVMSMSVSATNAPAGDTELFKSLVQIEAYLDGQIIGYFEAIGGDPPMVHYASGRILSSASRLSLVARQLGGELTAIVDNISIYTWDTDSGDNSICTTNGETYVAPDGSQFVTLCGIDLGDGHYYQSVPATSYARCLELCTDQGTICAGATWNSSQQTCQFSDISGFVDTGAVNTVADSAVRLTGWQGPTARSQQVTNGDFSQGFYSLWWTVESDVSIGDMLVSAGTQQLVFSKEVTAYASRFIHQNINGNVGDAYLLILDVSIPSDLDYTYINVAAYMGTNRFAKHTYQRNEITGSQRSTTLYASGTITQSFQSLRFQVEIDGIAWIGLDNIRFYTYSRGTNDYQPKTILSNAAYSFKDFAIASYGIPQVIAGQAFTIDLNDFNLLIPANDTVCEITLYTSKGSGVSETILFTGKWNKYSIPTRLQHFTNSSLIRGTTTAFSIDYLCSGTTGSSLSIGGITLLVDTSLQPAHPAPQLPAMQSFPTTLVPVTRFYVLSVGLAATMPPSGYCSANLIFDPDDPNSRASATWEGYSSYSFQITGQALTTDLTTLSATIVCYDANGWVPSPLSIAYLNIELLPIPSGCDTASPDRLYTTADGSRYKLYCDAVYNNPFGFSWYWSSQYVANQGGCVEQCSSYGITCLSLQYDSYNKYCILQMYDFFWYGFFQNLEPVEGSNAYYDSAMRVTGPGGAALPFPLPSWLVPYA